jgi:hypothetical protein
MRAIVFAAAMVAAWPAMACRGLSDEECDRLARRDHERTMELLGERQASEAREMRMWQELEARQTPLPSWYYRR